MRLRPIVMSNIKKQINMQTAMVSTVTLLMIMMLRMVGRPCCGLNPLNCDVDGGEASCGTRTAPPDVAAQVR